MVSLEWANSLVGRDWEIYWNDQEENDGKDNNSSSPTNEEKASKDDSGGDGDEQVVAETKTQSDITFDDTSTTDNKNNLVEGPIPMDVDNDLEQGTTKVVANVGGDSLESNSGAKVIVEENQQKEEKESDDDDDDDDDESVGSVINDWYAGRVVSVSQQSNSEGSTFTFKVIFIGEEETYEMTLDPSKVRPSAWGWIKRTKALLYSYQKIISSSSSSTTTDDKGDGQLPPDTSTGDDMGHLQRIQEEINSQQYGDFTTPDQSNTNGTGSTNRPVMEELRNILHFRYLLKSQIYLRSKLAKIETIQGSAKFTDGERNPTESYVNHLAQCLKDLDYACDWFCRSWNLFVKLFGRQDDDDDTSGMVRQELLTIDQILLEYLDSGKSLIENCLSIDFENSNSSNRRPPTTLNPLSSSSNNAVFALYI